jgi:protein N-terminal methyltransferase
VTQSVEASTEGVLGGYGCVNDADVKGSEAFLRPLISERFGTAKRHLVALGELISARRPWLVQFSSFL